MIKEISFNELTSLAKPFLQKQKRQDALLIRILSNGKAFSKNGLCRIYTVTKKEKLCGFALIYSGFLTLWLKGNPDIKELCFFINSAPITSMEASKKIVQKLKRYLSFDETRGKILYWENPPEAKPKNRVFETENVSDFYDTISLSHPSYKDTSYEQFYCDVFYRKEIPARLFLLECDGKNSATAAIMHRFDKTSILSDISVMPDMRRRGLAAEIVNFVAKDVTDKGDLAILFCVSPAAMRLYDKLGFKLQQKFSVLTLK